MITTAQQQIFQVRLIDIEYDFDWNPWGVAPDYRCGGFYSGGVFEVILDPLQDEEEMHSDVVEQVSEQIGEMWHVKQMIWEFL